jgi:hypothetical protein
MYIKQRGELFVLISSIVIRAPLIFSGLGINEPQHKKNQEREHINVESSDPVGRNTSLINDCVETTSDESQTSKKRVLLQADTAYGTLTQNIRGKKTS